jgi:hypothetical protein
MITCLHHIMNDCPDCTVDDFNKQCRGYCPVKTIFLEVRRNEVHLPKTQSENDREESQDEALCGATM